MSLKVERKMRKVVAVKPNQTQSRRQRDNQPDVEVVSAQSGEHESDVIDDQDEKSEVVGDVEIDTGGEQRSSARRPGHRNGEAAKTTTDISTHYYGEYIHICGFEGILHQQWN